MTDTKFLLVAATLIAATALASLGILEGTAYVALIISVVGAYVAGDVIQRGAEAKRQIATTEREMIVYDMYKAQTEVADHLRAALTKAREERARAWAPTETEE